MGYAQRTGILAGIVAAGAVCALLPVASVAKEAKKEDWRVRENLVTRLSGELYKINVLTRELSSVSDVISDMRDIELFPPEVLRCSEDSLVALDRKLELCEKSYQVLQKQVTSLTPALADGMGILREMVVARPVDDMFAVLDKDDVQRISKMFAVKHHIDSLWRSIDTLMMSFAQKVHLVPEAREAAGCGFEAEFFQILRANLGEQTSRYYGMLDVMKDSLFRRASDDQAKRMYQIEVHRIKENLKGSNSFLAAKKLRSMIGRYANHPYVEDLNFLLVKALFSQKAYDSVLAVKPRVSDTARFGAGPVLYSLQSLYELGRCDSVWKWAQTFPLETLHGSYRNCALWMVMESGLVLGVTGAYAGLASLVDKDSSYALHVMHALARSYVRAKDYTMALSVLDGALRFRADAAVDRLARQSMRLTMAQTLYEKGDYAKALTLFFDLVNSENEATFAQALYGISWCYIRLGMYQKADASLRKIINQAPQSPLAVRALLTIGRRYLNRAQYEWEKLTSLTNAENRLALMRQGLEEKLADTLSPKARTQATKAADRIDELLARSKSEKRESDTSIAKLYDEADRLSNMVQQYYATGSFQEVSFSAKREMLLHQLDSLLVVVKGASATSDGLSATGQTVEDIKNLVVKGKVFSAGSQLDRYRWEREHLDWQKSQASRALEALAKKKAKTRDSTAVRDISAAMASLNARMDSLVKTGDKLIEQWYGPLTRQCESLVSLPLDTADEIYLRYHDAELHYLHENEQYADAYAAYEAAQARYDSLMALFHEGKVLEMPVRPREPDLVHDSSMAQYTWVLKKFPHSSLDYAVRYSLAWCYNDLSKFDMASAQMDSVAHLYPACQYAPQAWMYIGEYMFDRAKLDKALAAYQAVLNYPESEWFDKALYKLAWAQYRLSNPEKAISSFLALVDLGDKAPSGKSLLEKESIDYIAISFSETDISGEKGLERATNFVKRFGDPEKGTQILHRLATIYKEQGRFDMSQKTYRALLKLYPDYKQSPQIESELLAVMEKSSTVDESNIRNVEFFDKYNKESEWSKAQADARAVVKADSLAQNHLYDAAVSYHQLALQKNDTLLYTTASESYEDFIRHYPTAARAGECHYNLAEIQFSIGNYQRAAEEYIAVSKRYPDSKYKETAAWNAIVASQNLLKKEGSQPR